MYKPPDTTLFGKSVEMKFKVSGKIRWFKGQITVYDGLTRKCGIYFPCDSEIVMCIPMTSTRGLLANLASFPGP